MQYMDIEKYAINLAEYKEIPRVPQFIFRPPYFEEQPDPLGIFRGYAKLGPFVFQYSIICVKPRDLDTVVNRWIVLDDEGRWGPNHFPSYEMAKWWCIIQYHLKMEDVLKDVMGGLGPRYTLQVLD